VNERQQHRIEERIVRWFTTAIVAVIVGFTLADGLLATVGVLLLCVLCGWAWGAFYWRDLAFKATLAAEYWQSQERKHRLDD
jgi:hypothetical protein